MKLRISVILDEKSWLNNYVSDFISDLRSYNSQVTCIHELSKIPNGDIMFILSFSKIIPEDYLKRNKHNLVIHGSSLPKGRGFSPVTWQILAGKNKIPVLLFEAQPELDAGPIYSKAYMELDGSELSDEIRALQAHISFQLCLSFVAHYPAVLKQQKIQKGQPTYYKRRRESDSELNIHKSLKSQFNLLRVVDNNNYPAFFNYRGHKYIVKITKGIK